MKKSLALALGIFSISVHSTIIPDSPEPNTNIINGVLVESHTQDDWYNEQARL
jgi:hypothetical protein